MGLSAVLELWVGVVGACTRLQTVAWSLFGLDPETVLTLDCNSDTGQVLQDLVRGWSVLCR